MVKGTKAPKKKKKKENNLRLWDPDDSVHGCCSPAMVIAP